MTVGEGTELRVRAEYLLTGKGRTLGPILKLLLDRGTKHAG